MARRKLSFTSRYVLAFGILMLIANALLGMIILHQSGTAMKSLIDKNMLDVAETAAGILDGDALEALTREDVGGESFREIAKQLTVFMNHSDIRYIYTVKQVDDGKYVFVVDPDPQEPGAFGEETIITEGLVQAGKGTAAVDGEAIEDRWGKYYSAFCPVYDSAGEIAGIVGIDFDADWYDGQVRSHTISIVVITILSVLLCGLVVFIITYNVRKRFGNLSSELSKLSASVDQLMEDAGGTAKTADPSLTDASAADEIEVLAGKIQTMQKDMATYERLQKDQYFRDTITGIPNLNYVRQFADEKLHKLQASGMTPAVIYFDIRSMVSYNTEYGYPRGDELLRLTAQTIWDTFPDALVGRGEGDHFIVIDALDGELEQKAIYINETVKKAAYGRTTGIQSAVVKMTQDMKAADGIQRARNTLKKIGDDLNIVCLMYSEEDDRDYLTDRYILQHFEEALQNGWIRVYYQPILRARTGDIAVCEALARWNDPVRGIISPGSFIPLLSRYHLLHKLDIYMVEQICKEHSRRQELGFTTVPVSVNISAQDFDYVDVPEALNRLLQKYNLPRTCIIVEITEQDLAQATDIFAEQLRRIRDYGYRLWLDDFGSGYSSLNVFSQYQVDRIKFDMDLVRHLDDHGGANRIIMKSIVSMCRQMGVHTLAEGIETEDHYQFLISIDCEMVQGFYFFRPEPLETLGEKLKTNHARAGQDA